MAAKHSHKTDLHPTASVDWIDKRSERYVHALLLAFLIPLTLIGIYFMAATWPGEKSGVDSGSLGYVNDSKFYSAEVTQITKFDCIANGATQLTDGTFSQSKCGKIAAKISNEDLVGEVITFDVEPIILKSGLSIGDKVSVLAIPTDTGNQYVFNDFERTNGILIILGIFLVVIFIITGFGGLRAILGLSTTFGLLIYYLIPTLLAGANVISSIAILLSATVAFVLYFVHGFSLKTGAAILGTLSGTVLAGFGAYFATNLLKLTGITDDEDLVLDAIASNVKLGDLLIASIIIASLGALNDVTVTQSSAVWELAQSQERTNRRSLFVNGMKVGRDHIASSIYTIAFAYVGSALVTLMLVTSAGAPFDRMINDELIAQEIVLILIGSIALAISTPITTGIAAVFASSIRTKEDLNSVS